MNNRKIFLGSKCSLTGGLQLVVLTICLIVYPFPGQADTLHPTSQSENVYQILKDNNSKAVQSLPRGEREMLMAMLSLKSGRLEEAIAVLQDSGLNGDPLVSVISAEAYRQQAVRAAAQVGDYANKSLRGQMKRLEVVNLSSGMEEAEKRLQAFLDKMKGSLGAPLDMLEMGSDVMSVFLVDKARSRIFVYRRDAGGSFNRVEDEYVVTGAQGGDKRISGAVRTPNGVYRFIKRLSGKELPSRYGPVAFPIDYPNMLDQLHHKSGSGIWMHGYATDVARRPPRDTKGCFALPNNRLLALSEYVQIGYSWVIIGKNLTFGEDGRRRALLKSVHSAMDTWVRDWQSLDANAYLSHYHPKFRSGKYNRKSWSRHKRRVNRHKKYIRVNISDFTIIRHPAATREGEAVLVEFNQRYQSNNYAERSRKRLYIVRKHAGSTWKILAENEIEALKKDDAGDLYALNAKEGAVPSASREIDKPLKSWVINLASFISRARADQLASTIHLSGPDRLFITDFSRKGKKWFRVRVGYYADQEKATRAMRNLVRKHKLPGAWLERITSHEVASM